MEKLQRRLRAFIVLAVLSGMAAVVYVATVKPAKASTDPTTTSLPPITLQELNLTQAPPLEGLASWWDSLKDQIKLQLTFNEEGRTKIKLTQINKLIWKIQNSTKETDINNLLISYRGKLNKLTKKLEDKNNSNDTQQQIIASILNHQVVLSELLINHPNLQQSLTEAQKINWEKLTKITANISSDDLHNILEKLTPAEEQKKLQRAVLLQTWQQILPPEKQEQLKSLTEKIINQLSSISAMQAGLLAEILPRLTTDKYIQSTIGGYLEKIQPSLKGLSQQLQEATTNNTKPKIPLFNASNNLNINIEPLTNEELTTRQRELLDATTKDELLAIREKWYNNQLLYLRLSKYHRQLLDTLNAKLQKVLGQEPKTTTPATPTANNETPLPLQPITPEQQAAADAYLRQLQQQYPDLPRPSTGQ